MCHRIRISKFKYFYGSFTLTIC